MKSDTYMKSPSQIKSNFLFGSQRNIFSKNCFLKKFSFILNEIHLQSLTKVLGVPVSCCYCLRSATICIKALSIGLVGREKAFEQHFDFLKDVEQV